jgi:1,4-alpha-glucan branching enzyme
MSLKKKPLKSKPVCKVTFTLAKEQARDAGNVHLVGEFNEWDITATPMRKQKDGAFTANLDLPSDREYQFRYLIDGEIWISDPEADKFAFSPFGDCENSVVTV